MSKSPIQWTNETWNPVVGCKRVSAGCDHCYAFALHDKRHIAWKRGTFPTAPAQYHRPFSQVQLLPARLDDPLHWRKPRMVFVNSMSDLFHDDVPDEFIGRVFGVMRRTPQHTYQILTKRPERMQRILREMTNYHAMKMLGEREYMQAWPLPNVWLGVSVENQQAADERIPLLLKTPAAVRFLSCEPLLGPVNLESALVYYDGNGEPYGLRNLLHWVIVGGESGPHARALDESWLREIMWQCDESGVPVFVKQLGTVWAREHHAKDHHGGNIEEWPEHLRIREFPTIGEKVG